MPLSRFGPATRTRGDRRAAALPDGFALALLDAHPDPIAATDSGGRLTWANRSFTAFIGREVDPGDGLTIGILAGPYADALEGVRLADLVRNGEGRIETTLFDERGLPRTCELRVERIEPAAGAATRLVTLRDLEPFERRSSELALQAEEVLREREMLEATTRALEVGIIAADDGERVLIASERAMAALGLSGERLEGQLLGEAPLPLAVRGAWLTFLTSEAPREVRRITFRRRGEATELTLKFVRVRGQTGRTLGSVLVLESPRPIEPC